MDKEAYEIKSFNCTFMELKSKKYMSVFCLHSGFNCTFMELKSNNDKLATLDSVF